MPGRLGGQLVDGGDPVTDEPVFVVDTGPADESNWSIVATDRSAADGSWSVTVPTVEAERYHAVAQFEGGETLKNALSKPFLTSQPFAQAGVVSVGFDVVSPAVRVEPAIPDSTIHYWDMVLENNTVEDQIGDKNLTVSEGSPSSISGGNFTSGEAVEFAGSDGLDSDGLLEPLLPDGVPFTALVTVVPKGEVFETDGANGIFTQYPDDGNERTGLMVKHLEGGDEDPFVFRSNNDSFGDSESYTGGVSTDEFYRLQVRVDEGGNVDLWVNLKESDGNENGFLDIDPHDNFTVGWNPHGEGSNSPAYFEGVIDELIFCDELLSDGELENDYNNQRWT